MSLMWLLLGHPAGAGPGAARTTPTVAPGTDGVGNHLWGQNCQALFYKTLHFFLFLILYSTEKCKYLYLSHENLPEFFLTAFVY